MLSLVQIYISPHCEGFALPCFLLKKFFFPWQSWSCSKPYLWISIWVIGSSLWWIRLDLESFHHFLSWFLIWFTQTEPCWACNAITFFPSAFHKCIEIHDHHGNIFRKTDIRIDHSLSVVIVIFMSLPLMQIEMWLECLCWNWSKFWWKVMLADI